jgi:hypothetical protein
MKALVDVRVIEPTAALALLSCGACDAVISDMARPEGPREGYVLLDAVRARGDSTPFFLWSSSAVEEDRREILLHGGQGCASRAAPLSTMAFGAILERMEADLRPGPIDSSEIATKIVSR